MSNVEIKKIVTIVGARPQFIKAAVVSRALNAYNSTNTSSLQEVVIHTGQHFDYNMSGIFFEELDIKKPDYHLGVQSGIHGHQTAQMWWRIEEVLLSERPDIVVVYGDTNSTIAGALAAAKLNVPIAHVEAGLRSFNRKMPEEINRVVTDHVSTLLFAPTKTAVSHLRTEGICGHVYLTGDVMFDSIVHNVGKAELQSSIISKLRARKGKYVLATVHRSENTDDSQRLVSIVEALSQIAGSEVLIWPLHPRTKNALSKFGIITDNTNILFVEPLAYLDLLVLEKHARIILTDSGGIQKEACWFGVPCITLRDETEWIETVELGWNQLAGAKTLSILQAFATASPGRAATVGDAGAALRIVRHITDYLNLETSDPRQEDQVASA